MRPSGNNATSLGRSLSVPLDVDKVRRKSSYEIQKDLYRRVAHKEFFLKIEKVAHHILELNTGIVYQNTLILRISHHK